MMDDLKNRQLLWLLKRFSSVTYWQRYKTAFEEAVLARESSLKKMNAEYHGSYARWLDGLINFEKGIDKLKKGERYVFVFEHPEGYLARADEAGHLAWRVTDPDEYNWDDVPDFKSIRQKAVHAFETYGRPPVINDTLQPDRQQIYIKPGTGFKTPAYYFGTFPATYPADLPPVPSPDDSIIVRPGDRFPVYGIYQPYIEVPGKGFLFKGPPRWEEYGCMMYGLQNTEVPVSNKWEDSPKPVIRNDVVWKLLWEDHRYEDGTIPEEEQSYFLDPPPARRPSSDSASKRCEPNQPCPRAGYWWTPANKDSRRYFEAGEIMPDYPHSKYGSTFWYREDGQ